jgi:hypothetical protein
VAPSGLIARRCRGAMLSGHALPAFYTPGSR